MALFPIHVVTETSDGNGYAEDWTREQFVQTMREAMQGTPQDLQINAVRTPFFLSPDMAVVITDAEYITGTHSQTMRYADILVLGQDPSVDVRALRSLERVYRAGVAHDPKAILAGYPARDMANLGAA